MLVQAGVWLALDLEERDTPAAAWAAASLGFDVRYNQSTPRRTVRPVSLERR